MNDRSTGFIETIRWSDGRYHLLDLHSQRMAETYEAMGWPQAGDIRDWLPDVPEQLRDMTVKCRVLYGSGGLERVDFEPYTVRCVCSMRMVVDDNIDYRLKFADRTRLISLRSRCLDADEIIVVKNGFVTDTSYSNLVFRSGDTFLTSDRPLLRGVMLRNLLNQGIVSSVALRPEDILPGNRYGITEAFLINAMMPLGSSSCVDVTAIKPISSSERLID